MQLRQLLIGEAAGAGQKPERAAGQPDDLAIADLGGRAGQPIAALAAAAARHQALADHLREHDGEEFRRDVLRRRRSRSAEPALRRNGRRGGGEPGLYTASVEKAFSVHERWRPPWQPAQRARSARPARAQPKMTQSGPILKRKMASIAAAVSAKASRIEAGGDRHVQHHRAGPELADSSRTRCGARTRWRG